MIKENIEYEIRLEGNLNISDLESLIFLQSKNCSIHKLRSKYFDTDDFKLLNNSIGLRVRRENGNWVQTTKFEAIDQSCYEYNQDIKVQEETKNYLDIDALPSKDFLQNKNYYIDFEFKDFSCKLIQQFEININRFSWTIKYLSGKIEISFDTGFIKKNNTIKTISEIEIELLEGKNFIIWQLAKEIIRHLPNLKIQFLSKAFRGYELCDLNWKKHSFKSIKNLQKLHNNIGNGIRDIILQNIKSISFFFERLLVTKDDFLVDLSIISIKSIRYIFHFLTSAGKSLKIEDIGEVSKFKYFNNPYLNILCKIKILNFVIITLENEREQGGYLKKNKANLSAFFLKEKSIQFALLEKIVMSKKTTNIFLDYGFIANKIPFLINDRNDECMEIVSKVKTQLEQRLRSFRCTAINRAAISTDFYLMALSSLLSIVNKQEETVKYRFYDHTDEEKNFFTNYEINKFKKFINERLTNQKISKKFKEDIFSQITKIL